MTSRFESSAVDVRMAAPWVDGAREVRCPKKMDQVIAGARCLTEQYAGCSCPSAVGRLVELDIAKAKEPGGKSEAATASRAALRERNERIIEQGREGVTAEVMSVRERLTCSHVRAICRAAGVNLPPEKRHVRGQLERDAEIIERLTAGVPVKKVARDMKASTERVLRLNQQRLGGAV